MKTNIGLFLAKRALLDPDREGLAFAGRHISYGEWNRRANQAARALAGLGVKPGDRVGLLLMNGPEFLETFFGLAKLGAIVVPLNWRLAPPELAYIANDSGISTLVYGAEFREAVAAIRGDIPAKTYVFVGEDSPAGDHAYEGLLAGQPTTEPEAVGEGDDPLTIMYTSGTTGRPKGAVLSHANLFWDSCTVSRSLDWRQDDRVLVALPLFHIGALIYVIIDIHVGSTTVLMRAFDPAGFLQTVQDEAVNSFLAVPAMLNFMLQVPNLGDYDLSSVRWALVGTAPVPVPLIHAWVDQGIAIQQVYGLTEATGGVAVLGAAKALEKVGSTGLPMFHTDVRVVDAAGQDVAPGEIGELLVRAPHVMLEYWNNPEATAETIENGWLHTGDLARLDDEGYIYIADRLKDMIISGGENIYPAEVEDVLHGLPQLAEVTVIGRPDPEWGEVPVAVARFKEGESLTLEEIQEFCEGKLARYKIPKQLAITEQPLPRTPAGKVLKR
ncbi:MAG: long-chain fatty acid--CoA ligase, partial [Anaerolineae bacterium]